MFEEVRKGPLFAKVPEEKVHWILEQGTPVKLQAGEVLFSEGKPSEHFYVLKEGELQVSKRLNGQDVVLTTHSIPGSFTGAIPMITGMSYIAKAQALKETTLVCFDTETFDRILLGCPVILRVLLPELTSRIQNIETVAMQQEKLAALGKLSAGLAHELNNPASAAKRATAQLRDTIMTIPDLTYQLYQHGLTPQVIKDIQQKMLTHIQTIVELDPLERSDKEEELATWMEEHGVEDGWELAPTFIEAGLDCSWFDKLIGCLDTAIVPDVIVALEKTMQVFELLNTVEQSTDRLTRLVHAIKSYSYMDQAPLQEIDIHNGLETTLTILQHKLKSITLIREYERSLPRVCAYGSELNQVWTNLLDNASDALEGRAGAQIWLRTRRENDSAVVEIADNGPGIPKEIHTRIFDPFFTTKGVGKGTGLGLDIAYRIVVNRHHGDMQVQSQPDYTCFTIRLPIDQ